MNNGIVPLSNNNDICTPRSSLSRKLLAYSFLSKTGIREGSLRARKKVRRVTDFSVT